MRPALSASPLQLRLLRAALAEARPAREAFLEWSETVDLEALDVESTRLLPLLAANLTTAGVEHPWMAKLQGVHRSHWYRNQVLLRRLVGVAEDLSSASVAAQLSMGAALAPLYYPDNGARSLHDAAVLVQAEHAIAAARRLAASGWTALGLGARDFAPPIVLARDGAPFRGADGLRFTLRWRRLDASLRPGAEDDLWAEAQGTQIEGCGTVQVAGAAPLLLEVCAGADASPLGWVADACMILRRRVGDWSRLAALAQARGLDSEVTEMLAWLGEHIDPTVVRAPLEELRAGSGRSRSRSWAAADGLPCRARRHLRAWARLRREGGDYSGLGGAALYLRQALAVHSAAEMPRRLCRALWRRLSRGGRSAAPTPDGARANGLRSARRREPR